MKKLNMSSLINIEIMLEENFSGEKLYLELYNLDIAKEYEFLDELNVELISLIDYLEWENGFSLYMKSHGIEILTG